MINAEVSKAANNMIMVRFSEPNEEFKNNNWIPVQNEEEVKRRVYFKNRLYIYEKMTGWVKQRKYSAPSNGHQLPTNLLAWLSNYQNASFFQLCDFLKAKRKEFEAIAPGEKSRFYNHYIKVIVPILDFAESEEDNQR